MFGMLKMVAGFGAGYVLGARAGRERYDQIAARTQALLGDATPAPRADRGRPS